MAAVLAVALLEYQKSVNASDAEGRRRFAEVDAWFKSEDVSWPFSFASICEALGFDPSHFRDGVRAAYGRDSQRRSSVEGSNRAGVPMYQLKPGVWHS